jgi:hypothetical protein
MKGLKNKMAALSRVKFVVEEDAVFINDILKINLLITIEFMHRWRLNVVLLIFSRVNLKKKSLQIWLEQLKEIPNFTCLLHFK